MWRGGGLLVGGVEVRCTLGWVVRVEEEER